MFVYWVLIMTGADNYKGAITTLALPTREACITVGDAALKRTTVHATTCVRVEVPASQKEFLTMAK